MEAKHSQGQPRALISRDALIANAKLLRRAVAPGVRICGMVKADAYGHGAAIVAHTLANVVDPFTRKAAVDAFAVATIEEAAELPDSPLPVLVMRPLENSFVGRQKLAIELAIHSGWTLTICSMAAVDDLSRIALSLGKRASVQVMIDTGMTRSGVSPDDTLEVLRKIDSRPSLQLVGLCSHFASSEVAGHPFTKHQLASFAETTEAYAIHHAGKLLRHMANSGGIFFAPQAHLDMVRPGISLLGIDPTGKPNLDRRLRPVMHWTAPIVAAHDVVAGQSVGYGQSWIAPKATRIGVVAVGYADGYCRAFGGKAHMILGGKLLPVVGRVSMDLTTVDLGGAPEAVIGDEVTVLDSDPVSPASVYKLAEIAGTIPYEIFCRIGKRVLRVAIEPDDEEVAEERGLAREENSPAIRR